MADPRCHYCEDDAVTRCATCGRLFCDDHGEDVCLRCMAPESATPSVVAFRGSLVALVVGTLVAVFLVLSPPGSKSGTAGARPAGLPIQLTPTATATVRAAVTPTMGANAGASVSATASGSPAAGATASATVGASGERTHVVASGNTLSGIAAEYGTTVDAILALNPGVTADNITIGQTLKIPAR
jgi:nucleoid-associated protein YgaU